MLLQAGPITVWYENGFLRYVNYKADELLRMVYFALRDENWNTVEKVIENEDIRIEDHSFLINYDCYHKKNKTPIFYWKVTISGDEAGKIAFEIDGHALSSFQKNRLGFCVLHPLGNYDEQAIAITHSNGTVSQTQFPEFIAADNPFKNIRSFNWQNGPMPYTIDFEGDVFETEDQRNWADASFKTYCTPINLPFPVSVNQHDRCYQKIVFKPDIGQDNLFTKYVMPITLSVQNNTFNLPNIGVGASDETGPLSEETIALINELGLDHYAIDIDPSAKNWISVFTVTQQQAQKLKLPLVIKLHLSHDFINEIAAFATLHLKQIPIAIKAVILLSKGQPVTSQRLVNYASSVRVLLPGILIGAGTDFNFTEINQNHFDAGDLQFISYSSHPQEHAFDDLTLIENIAAQAETVKSIRKIYGEDMPVFISPVTLKKRFNPYATDPLGIVKSSIERCDDRQALTFCALFTLGSIKSLTISKTTSVSFFQTVGSQGIISLLNEPHPVYEALKLVHNMASKRIISTVSSAPLVVDSLLFENNNLLIWNYTDKTQSVLLPNGSEVNLAACQVLTINYLS